MSKEIEVVPGPLKRTNSIMPRWFFRLFSTAVAIGVTAGATYAQRTYTVDDLERVRQPAMLALSPDGSSLSYVLGDTLWIVPTDGSAGPHPISEGMKNQINYDQPFLAWSSTGEYLLYRAGEGGIFGQGAPMVYNRVTDHSKSLLPQPYVDRLQTFLHWAADSPIWSPDGSRVALLAADTTSEANQYLRLYTVDPSSHSVSLIASDTAGPLPLGGVASVAWSPDGRWLAYGTGTFRGNAGRLVLRALDGEEETVLETGAPMYRLLTWSPDGHLLSALRHGGNRILLRVAEDGEAHLVNDSVPFIEHEWTVDGRLIGNKRSGMSAALATWAPGDEASSILTQGDTLFQLVGASTHDDPTLVAFSKETGELPLDVWIAELPSSGHRLEDQSRVTHTNSWLDSVYLARARIESWASPEGDRLHALLFLPPETVAAPPYPLVVRPYGSYTNEFPTSEYFMDAGTQLLAGQGWAVVLPNTRGMSGNPLTGRYGAVQLEDTRPLIDKLAGEGAIAPQRIAVLGHSHGGAMAYYYLTHAEQDEFCAVVAVNGWSDWSQIANRLQVNDDQQPGKLARYSPILNSHTAVAPLLAVSGENDTQVLPENAERMVDAMQQQGNSAEWLHFDEEGHLLTNSSNRRIFWTRALNFFDQNCQSAP